MPHAGTARYGASTVDCTLDLHWIYCVCYRVFTVISQGIFPVIFQWLHLDFPVRSRGGWGWGWENHREDNPPPELATRRGRRASRRYALVACYPPHHHQVVSSVARRSCRSITPATPTTVWTTGSLESGAVWVPSPQRRRRKQAPRQTATNTPCCCAGSAHVLEEAAAVSAEGPQRSAARNDIRVNSKGQCSDIQQTKK